MYNQYVVFILDDKNFAIKIEHVIEIINFHEVFKIPNSLLILKGL